MFRDSFTANQILYSDTPYEAKCLSKQIQGADNDRWLEDRYDIYLEGIHAKFQQTHPKILEEALYDKTWGTGITLQNSNTLDSSKWVSRGWLSNMLLTVREESKNAFTNAADGS